MINFKKVVSMAVVLSLMLGACEKNPARRDGGTATDTATDLRALEEKNRKLTEQGELEEWVSPKGIGAGVAGGAVGGFLGTVVVIMIANALVACSCCGSTDHNFSTGKEVAEWLTTGALTGAGAGVISGGIFGKMSDGWGKLMLKTGLIGLGAVVGSNVASILAAFIKGELK